MTTFSAFVYIYQRYDHFWLMRMAVIDTRTKRWGIAWLALAAALALHILDEVLTDFLPFYNSIIRSLRATFAWTPFPTFTFTEWIAGLVVGTVLLFLLSPLVFSGYRFLRPVSYFLGILMVVNGFGHIGASIYLGSFAPGFFSSPLLILSGTALLATTYGTRRCKPLDRNGVLPQKSGRK